MSNFFKVKEFMQKFKQEVKSKPSFPDDNIIKLRIKLIKEELLELEEALNEKNIEETADALTDILYVTYGAGHAFGIDLDKKERVTFSKRASNACWSPSSEKIAFVAHKNSSSNLFVTSISNLNKVDRITNYSGDVQIVTPSWSPDGSSIAYAVSKDDGNMDIVIFKIFKTMFVSKMPLF